MTHPLQQAAAQKRYLQSLGMPYIERPDGRPLVSRDGLAARLLLQSAPGQGNPQGPNRAALLARFGARKTATKKAAHGSTT